MPRLGQGFAVPMLSAVEVKMMGRSGVPWAKIFAPWQMKRQPNWVVSLVPLMMVPASMVRFAPVWTYTLPVSV